MTLEQQLAEVKYSLDVMVHAHAEQRVALQERDRQYWELKNRVNTMAAGIRQIQKLMNESTGVTGYHYNGTIADWDSLGLDDFDSAAMVLMES